MARSGRILAALLAVGSVTALGVPEQRPLDLPSWSPSKSAGVADEKPMVNSEELQDKITAENLLARAEDLYRIAESSIGEYGHPTRVIGSNGHWATLEYITSSLLKLGSYYNVSTQEFPVTSGYVYEARLVLGDEVLTSAAPAQLTPATKDREPVHGELVLVKNGCEASDFPANVSGNVVLVQRGECSFGQKSELGGKAGAVTVLIYNNEEGGLYPTLGTPVPDHVATFGLTREDGSRFAKKLEAGEAVDVISYINAELSTVMTSNIIAQTTAGDPDNCVMLGGHTDGVTAGPGINDDGSGSLSILEVATLLAEYDVNNCVRFAWWSAEEEGLIGSDYYVSVLSDEEKKKIRLFMDYDMLASPNFAYEIYDANNKANPVGSSELKKVYIDWFEDKGLNYTFIPFDGRSDYDAFIRNGIPGGGISTGAEGVKTKKEAAEFGGLEGEWYDPCYHQLCDDVSNLNVTAWVVNTKLVAHALAVYANSFDDFPQRVDTFNVASYHDNVKYHGPNLVL